MTYRIALIGYGNIGQGFIRSFTNDLALLEQRTGKKLEIGAVVCRNPERKRDVPPPTGALVTSEWRSVVTDERIDGVVEVIGVDGDGKPGHAYEIAKESLYAGKDFITANKALIATHGGELHAIAKQKNALLLYEASVGAGIPIISSLQGALAPNQVRGLYGIVNGTCNYILTRIEEQPSLSMANAIKEAQDLGYAEPDPRSDVEGEDAAYKLSILASLSFGRRYSVDNIHQIGITTLSAEDSSYARKNDFALKLLAIAKQTEEGVSLTVSPTFFPNKHILAAVRGGFNGLLIDAEPLGQTFSYGPGAGQNSTASGLLADMVLAARTKGCGAARQLPLSIPSHGDVRIDNREPVYFRVTTAGNSRKVATVRKIVPGAVLFEDVNAIAIKTAALASVEIDNLVEQCIDAGIVKADIGIIRYALGA